jgi:hypothetical protein
MAFARFYCNRICKAIDGGFEPLPSLAVEGSASTAHTPASNFPAAAEIAATYTSADPALETARTGDDLIRCWDGTMKTRSNLRTILLHQFRDSTTFHADPTIKPIVFACRLRARSRYLGAVDGGAKNQVLSQTQHTAAMSVLFAL